MRLKFMCLTSMEDDDCKDTRKNKKYSKQLCCPNSKNNKHNKMCSLSQKCNSVINEYKQTRMSLLRDRCDKTGNDINLHQSNSSLENVPTKCNLRNTSSSESDEWSLSNYSKSDSNYEERFEQSVENIPISSSKNSSEDDNDLSYRHKFTESNISNIGIETINRITQLSTKSNSDSQLEYISDFCRNFKNNSTLNNDKHDFHSDNDKQHRALEILKELIETERNYVDSLRCVVDDYLPEMQRKDIVQGLRGQKFAVFCNVEKIYEFHKNTFLKDIEKCISNWNLIGSCFLKHEKLFDVYSLYNKNKPKSDEIMADYGSFFEEKRLLLGDSLNLSSLLLKPVQRLARYSLLLEKLLKECQLGSECYKEIFKAKEMITYILRHGDDLLVMDGIKNCDVNLNEQGKLLRQEEFLLIEDNAKKPLKRRIFLFEELILFSVPNKTNPLEFHCCNSMKMSDVGITDYGDTIKFIIWFRKYQFQKYTLQAFCPEVKTAWVNEITNILMKQAEQYKIAKQAELAELGIQGQTRIPIQEEESDEDEKTSNKKYYSMRSLRGVAGEIKPKKVIDRTTWYCPIRDDSDDSS